MRRLLLTSQKELMANDYLSTISIGNKYGSTYLHPKERVKKMMGSFHGNYKKYLNLIYTNFDKLIILKPSEFQQMVNEFDLLGVDLTKKFRIQGYKTKHSFGFYVESALQYALIRKYVFPKYIWLIGIKTCVYCNANYAVTDHHGVAYYDLDHYKPKSKYPYLSISFFNLQPSCPVCNRLKQDDTTELYMNLWEENFAADRDVFRFSIPKKNRIQYWMTHDRNCLSIRFLSAQSSYDSMRTYMDKQLHISAIYREHRDVAEEILWRKKVYCSELLQALHQSFNSLKLTSRDVERLIAGTYMGKDDIHKRPLTKLIQDIYNEG